MFKSVVYHGNSLIGEVEIHPQSSNIGAWIREIRISHFSPPSDRCPPLAVLRTTAAISFKMESKSRSPLLSIYTACLEENKTAVVPLPGEEIHLVAMPSRRNLKQCPCFWGFSVMPKVYNSCLVMLNLRCLGIVFDLDETLIVANTMRSFEDKIDALQRKISTETDPHRVTGMLAEVKRYQDDKSILKQYIENDQVVVNGKVFEAQSEIVPPQSDCHQLISRPIIRLQERILTRVNPAIRDTSVLVRLRPAWEDLRSYLTARGRKRFEVYVCTMAERDYALEMWRLLDPESSLINSRELMDRIVCVKSGTRKSLLSVFQDGICHPKMSLVIDDRLKVWDEKDQPRVHVVPAFAPYYAPEAEANSSVPVLCVARNVACNVRGVFFKDFDEGLCPQIVNVFYEDEMINILSAPDVVNYLNSEDDTSVLNGNNDVPCIEGMAADVGRFKDANYNSKVVPPVINNFEPRSMPFSSEAVLMASTQMMPPFFINQCSQYTSSCMPLGQSGLSEPGLQTFPAIEEGELAESEVDPNTRRRLLISQHGQDTRDLAPPPCSVIPPPLQLSVPLVHPQGAWFRSEEEINPRHLRRELEVYPLEREPVLFRRNRSYHSSLVHGGENLIPSNGVRNECQLLSIQGCHGHGDDRSHSNNRVSKYRSFQGEEMPVGRTSFNYRGMQFESGGANAQFAESPVEILQEIAMKCGTKVEFRTALCATTELQFSIEAWFIGEKIGEGIDRTRKEAQRQAAERSLQNLANKFLSSALLDPIAVHGDWNKTSHVKENGFFSDSNPAFIRDDLLPITSTSRESHFWDHNIEGPENTTASVLALKELCITEGYSLNFQAQPSPSMGSVDKREIYAQVEIAGQILGKGFGTTWEEAKHQAADEALGTLKSMLGQFTLKRSGAARSLSTTPSKRLKQDFSCAFRRIPSFDR